MRWFLLLISVSLFVSLLALGTWQVQRRHWNLALLERTTQRVHAAVTPAPEAALWPTIDAAHYEYQHISAHGTWHPGCSAWVQAVTEMGTGFWLLMPLDQPDGSSILINRGFVSTETRAQLAASQTDALTPQGAVTITGLLRITEPRGGFLRQNDPQADRWFSRDVAAIGARCQIPRIAPYFVDADASPTPIPNNPVGGLTVISFHNNHLVYALTWYALALMAAWGGWRVLREPRP